MAIPPTLLWPVHPKPLPGEALSSWLLRIADGNGLDQRAFKHYLPKTHGISADIDLIDDTAFFTAIATWSATPEEDIAALGFARDEGLVFRHTATHPNWIIPRDRLGKWPEKRHIASQPYCPACLATDVTPYYRKTWRYAFHPICPKHGLLPDHCLSCGHPFSYLALGSSTWNSYSTHALQQCTACGTHFAKQQTTFNLLEQHTLEAQTFITDGLKQGWIQLGNKDVPIVLFLSGLHILAEALLNQEHGKKMCSWFQAQHPGLFNPKISWFSEGGFERQSSPARAWLLVFIFWLSQDWPKRWVTIINETGISGSACLPQLKSIPSWMHSEEIEQLRFRDQRRSPDEITSAKAVLTRLRGWPANDAELAIFMNTGVAPLLKPRSFHVIPEAHKAFSNRAQTTLDANEPTIKYKNRRHQPTKELCPPILVDDCLTELFEDMDDTENSIPTLKRLYKNQRGKS